MAKKSATQAKTLEDSCTGTKKQLEGGGFTCRNADGKQVTCIPNDDTTFNCWVAFEPDSSHFVEAIHQATVAVQDAQLDARSSDIGLRRAALSIDRLKQSLREL